MAEQNQAAGQALSDAELEEMVASSDTGGRNPSKRSLYLLMAGLALAWSLFQLWFASPIPSILSQYESTRWIAAARLRARAGLDTRYSRCVLCVLPVPFQPHVYGLGLRDYAL